MKFSLMVGLAALVAGTFASGARAAEQPKGYLVGDTPADFSLPTLDGKTVKLSDYKEKVVVLHIFAYW